MPRLLKSLFTPRWWLAAGVFLVGASIAIKYHHDQQVASQAMAEKAGLPPLVLIQDFSSAKHTNLMNELRVLAEVDMQRLQRINVGDEGNVRLVDMAPVYPVSRESFALAMQHYRKISKAKARPMPRANASNVRDAYNFLAKIEQLPVGVLAMEVTDAQSPEATLESFAKPVFATGENGVMVGLSGLRLNAPDLLSLAKDAFSQNGVNVINDAIVVSPYNTQRATYLVEDHRLLRRTLLFAGLVSFLTGTALLFSWVPQFAVRKPRQTRQSVAAVQMFSTAFQPIATQDEILVADESKETSSRKIMSRAVTKAFGMAKNQP